MVKSVNPHSAWKRGAATSAGCLVTLIATHSTSAQTAAGQDAEKVVLEELVVTGTSIRGVAPVGSPVVAVSAKDIEATGLSATADILRTVPQVLNLGAGEMRSQTNANNANANTFFAEGINIRGLGPQATLVLVNGHRPAPQGLQASFFDVSNIPTIALSGIEIVADGASAIYGADAMAGVANLIFRDNFDGAQLSVRYGLADDYRTRRVSGLLGETWGTGNVLFAAEYFDHPTLSAADRPELFLGVDTDLMTLPAAATVPPTYNRFSSPTTLTTGTGAGARTYAIPRGLGNTPPTAAQITPNLGFRNVQSVWSKQNPVGGQERASAVLVFNQDIGERVELYSQAFYSMRDFFDRTGAAATTTLTLNSARNPYAAFLPTLPGAPTTGQVSYSFGDMLGPQDIDGESHNGQFVIGTRIALFGDWRLDVSATQNYSQDVRLLKNAFNQCALTGVPTRTSGPCTGGTFGVVGDTTLTGALNPFGVSDPSVAARIRARSEQHFQINMQDFVAKIDGTLFQIPGGDLKAAVGAEYIDQKNRYQNFGNTLSANNTIFQRNTGGAKTQNIKSAFVEFVVPIVGAGNAKPGVESLQLSLAGRIDDYNLYSDPTKNPKFGLTWEPTGDLQLTASYGESFRSSLKDIDPNNAPNVTVNQQYFDYSVNRNVSSVRWLSGNPELEPETAETKTFGVRFAPQALPGFVGSATYFDISYEDIIDQPGGNLTAGLSSADQEAIFAAYIIRRPPATDVAGNAAFNALVQQLYDNPAFQGTNPPAPSTISLIVDNRGYNAGSLKAQGIDLSLSYAWESSFGEWITTLDGSYFLTFERSLTNVDPLVDRLNYIDFPTRYRARAQLGWRKGGFGANLFLNYLPSYTNTYTTPTETIEDTKTLDLSLSYRTGPEAAMDMLSDITVALSAQNVLDEDPPYALIRGIQTYDSNYASPLGRMVSLQVMKAW